MKVHVKPGYRVVKMSQEFIDSEYSRLEEVVESRADLREKEMEFLEYVSEEILGEEYMVEIGLTGREVEAPSLEDLGTLLENARKKGRLELDRKFQSDPIDIRDGDEALSLVYNDPTDEAYKVKVSSL